MPKFGQRAAPAMAPAASPIPMAQPAAATASAMPQVPAGGLLSGIFGGGGQGDPINPETAKMIMAMLASGVSQANQSNSPIAALIAPIASALIGKSVIARSAPDEGMASALYGDLANDPQAQSYFRILDNPSAPAYLKTEAKKRLDALVKSGSGGQRSGGGTGRRTARPGSSAPASDKLHTRLSGDPPFIGPDGKTYKRDWYGNPVEMPMPGGAVVAPTAADSSPEDDPLGILSIPPA